jgi:Raf kinase inhibitor-like YbhB/YbcL family protein
MNNLELTSPAFVSGEDIPVEYTCDGDNTNPPLLISGVPDTAAALVLIMDDPDVPKELRDDQHFVHWVAFNIAPDTTGVPAGTKIGTDGKNSTGDMGYVGPCPPTQYEPKTHRYFFRLYAVDGLLDLPEGATQEEVSTAIDGRIVGQAELMGRYSRLQ